MAKHTSFSVSKPGANSGKAGVFRDVTSGSYSSKVMSGDTYARASERASKSLAGSTLTNHPPKKR